MNTHNVYFMEEYRSLSLIISKYRIYSKLELVFVKHYAPTFACPQNGQICNVVIPQKNLDFAQTFNR